MVGVIESACAAAARCGPRPIGLRPVARRLSRAGRRERGGGPAAARRLRRVARRAGRDRCVLPCEAGALRGGGSAERPRHPPRASPSRARRSEAARVPAAAPAEADPYRHTVGLSDALAEGDGAVDPGDGLPVDARGLHQAVRPAAVQGEDRRRPRGEPGSARTGRLGARARDAPGVPGHARRKRAIRRRSRAAAVLERADGGPPHGRAGGEDRLRRAAAPRRSGPRRGDGSRARRMARAAAARSSTSRTIRWTPSRARSRPATTAERSRARRASSRGSATRAESSSCGGSTPGGRFMYSAEDLSTIGPVGLLADLAVIATLGIDEPERNGYHYLRSISTLPPRVDEETIRHHGGSVRAPRGRTGGVDDHGGQDRPGERRGRTVRRRLALRRRGGAGQRRLGRGCHPVGRRTRNVGRGALGAKTSRPARLLGDR